MSTALRVTWPLFGGAATKWHSWQAFCVLGEGSGPAADGGKEAQLVRGLCDLAGDLSEITHCVS